MEPVSATLALIAATKTAVEAAKNVKDIGTTLDQLFSSHEGAEKKQKRKKATTRRQQILRMRSGDEGYDDDTSISAVANQVLDEKQKQLALEGLAKEIDKKWGHGTWSQILDQRQKLLKEKAEAAKVAKAKARQQKIDDKIFWHKVLVESAKVVFLLLVIGGIGWWLHYAANAPKVR